MLADAATLWQNEVNLICSLRSCDGGHWDPTIYWPKLPDLWQQRHSETVDFLFSLISLYVVCCSKGRSLSSLHRHLFGFFFWCFLQGVWVKDKPFYAFQKHSQEWLAAMARRQSNESQQWLSVYGASGRCADLQVRVRLTHKAKGKGWTSTLQGQKRWNDYRISLALKIRFVRELLCKHKILCCFCCFSYNLGSGTANIAVNGTFNDGKWHRVKAVR